MSFELNLDADGPDLDSILATLEDLEAVDPNTLPAVCEDGDCAGGAFLEDGIVLAPLPSETRWRFKIGCLGGIPEFKTKTCYRRIGGVRVPYPCVFKRTCKKCFYIDIAIANVPRDITKEVEECAKIAAVAALPLILVGQFAAALAAATQAFKTCIVAKIGEVGVRVGLHETKECSDWSRV